jgi:hypothetical protein
VASASGGARASALPPGGSRRAWRCANRALRWSPAGARPAADRPLVCAPPGPTTAVGDLPGRSLARAPPLAAACARLWRWSSRRATIPPGVSSWERRSPGAARHARGATPPAPPSAPRAICSHGVAAGPGPPSMACEAATRQQGNPRAARRTANTARARGLAGSVPASGGRGAGHPWPHAAPRHGSSAARMAARQAVPSRRMAPPGGTPSPRPCPPPGPRGPLATSSWRPATRAAPSSVSGARRPAPGRGPPERGACPAAADVAPCHAAPRAVLRAAGRLPPAAPPAEGRAAPPWRRRRRGPQRRVCSRWRVSGAAHRLAHRRASAPRPRARRPPSAAGHRPVPRRARHALTSSRGGATAWAWRMAAPRPCATCPSTPGDRAAQPGACHPPLGHGGPALAALSRPPVPRTTPSLSPCRPLPRSRPWPGSPPACHRPAASRASTAGIAVSRGDTSAAYTPGRPSPCVGPPQLKRLSQDFPWASGQTGQCHGGLCAGRHARRGSQQHSASRRRQPMEAPTTRCRRRPHGRLVEPASPLAPRRLAPSRLGGPSGPPSPSWARPRPRRRASTALPTWPGGGRDLAAAPGGALRPRVWTGDQRAGSSGRGPNGSRSTLASPLGPGAAAAPLPGPCAVPSRGPLAVARAADPGRGLRPSPRWCAQPVHPVRSLRRAPTASSSPWAGERACRGAAGAP